jgi:hypothetical protein
VRAAPTPDRSYLRDTPQGPLHVATRDLLHEGRAVRDLIVLHDMSFAQRRSDATKRYLFYLLAAIAVSSRSSRSRSRR